MGMVRELLEVEGSTLAVQLWQIHNGCHGNYWKTIEGHQGWVFLAFSHDSQMLASGSGDATVKLWDASTGECLRTFVEHNNRPPA
jgi:WD40 repeat protein